MYAFNKATELKLFDHGVEFIEKHTAKIGELPQKYNFPELKKDYKSVNASTQTILDELESMEHTLQSIENHKKGEKVTVEELTEEMVKMRKDLNEMKPALGSMSKLSIDAVKASTAAEDYLWDSKKLLAYHQVDYIWKKYDELKKKINHEVRAKYEKYNRLVRKWIQGQRSPYSMIYLI